MVDFMVSMKVFGNAEVKSEEGLRVSHNLERRESKGTSLQEDYTYLLSR